MRIIGHKSHLPSLDSTDGEMNEIKHGKVSYKRDQYGKWRRQTADAKYNNYLNKLRQKAIHELGYKLDDIYPLSLDALKELCAG